VLKDKFKYFLLIFAIAVTGCAKRGSITGGMLDTIPPTLTTSVPKNFSTGFEGNTIRLTFDEYIKLRNLNKQLIVSPPMKTPPTILPLNASKYITIKINDTLQPNTTYSFNFGQSIEDNNESNPYPQFKYVFSTGTYIDSLTLGGTIKDAYTKETDNFVSVMLYEVNDTFADSTIYKENPRYITNTLDSLTTFRLENLKEGKYLLVAMKDYNGNNKFDPKKDKIGFHRNFVTLPNDTLYELELFHEEIPFRAFKPSQVANSRLLMGYEGKTTNVAVTVRNGAETVPSVVTQMPEKDSLQIWHKPIKVDSLQVSVSKADYNAEFSVRIKAQSKDSLAFKQGSFSLRTDFTLNSSIPLTKIDSTRITIIKKDSAAVAFTTSYDNFTQSIKFKFQKDPLENYIIKALPGAFIDFYDQVNDTLTYKLTTKNTSEYGNLRMTLENVRQFPVIVELTNAKGNVVATEYSEGATSIEFNFLEPEIYTLRVIYDENKNREWDTGSFLLKRQSEEVIYFPRELNVRGNWDVNEIFRLR
jgi:hypothetical protein